MTHRKPIATTKGLPASESHPDSRPPRALQPPQMTRAGQGSPSSLLTRPPQLPTQSPEPELHPYRATPQPTSAPPGAPKAGKSLPILPEVVKRRREVPRTRKLPQSFKALREFILTLVGTAGWSCGRLRRSSLVSRGNGAGLLETLWPLDSNLRFWHPTSSVAAFSLREPANPAVPMNGTK